MGSCSFWQRVRPRFFSCEVARTNRRDHRRRSRRTKFIGRRPRRTTRSTAEEIRTATDVARTAVSLRATPGQPATAPELLYVQRDDDKESDDERRADAYTYDYAQDKVTIVHY